MSIIYTFEIQQNLNDSIQSMTATLNSNIIVFIMDMHELHILDKSFTITMLA